MSAGNRDDRITLGDLIALGLATVDSNGRLTGLSGSGGSSTLAGDTDVNISSPVDGQVLIYNSATSKWENRPDPIEFPYTVRGDLANGTVGATIPNGANNAVWMMSETGGTVSKIALYIITSSGNIDLGFYSTSGTGISKAPATRIVSTGSIASPGVGYREFSLGASYRINRGDFFAISADNTTFQALISLGTTQGFAIAAPWTYYAASSFPLPTPAPAVSLGAGRTFVMRGVA